MSWFATLAAALAAASASEPAPAGDSLTRGPWQITLAGEPTRVGPLVVVASKLKVGTGNAWVRHQLVFENRSDAPVTVDDTRSSRFIGNRRLLAADEGCGWGYDNPGAPAVAGGCESYLDRIVVPPGGQERRNVYLTKGLRGMRQLTPGRYRFQRPVETRRSKGTARLVYEVERR